MERRREYRTLTDESALITVLGDNAPAPLQARVVEMSGLGMRLIMDTPVAAGAALKIELHDALLLGEVSYCYPDCGHFVAGLHLDQALNGLKDLARLNRRLLQEERNARTAPAHEVATPDRLS